MFLKRLQANAGKTTTQNQPGKLMFAL